MTVRMRHTRGHTRNRRSHHALTANAIVTDKESGALRLPHRLDETTGMYRGKLIVPERKAQIKEDAERKVKHSHEQEHDHTDGVKEPIHTEEKADKKQGLMGRMSKGKVKARSGMGGVGSS
ncbi:50S ribosomal protein L32 [Patescibacteria group bacterium]|nr:50S ribosomal protein L32 [Patescibacteria group bacterium]MBU1755358.1 50S ribosomal protein L32 [Patescibacteria group bacterium]